MVSYKKRIIENGTITGTGIVLATSMILIFMLLSFNERMALVYMLMLCTYYFWYTADNNITLPVEKSSKGRLVSIVYAAAILAAFIAISTLLGKIDANSVFKLWATNVPVFAGNKILTYLAWGVLIPIIETALFFGIFYEGMAYYAGRFMGIGPISTKLDLANIPLWFLMIGVSFVFCVFHFQTRGLNSVALLLVAIFGIISCLTVSFFGQTREAIIFHIFGNSLAIAAST
jgi:hypothetical protein